MQTFLLFETKLICQITASFKCKVHVLQVALFYIWQRRIVNVNSISLYHDDSLGKVILDSRLPLKMQLAFPLIVPVYG